MASAFIEFHVDGLPRPKGSTRSFPRTLNSGRTIIQTVADNDGVLKRWQKAVATAAALKVRTFRFTGPVAVTLGFYLPHPTTGKRRLAHVTRPDVDKLQRAVLDALTGVLWGDDSQVTDVQAYKRYAARGATPHLIVMASDAEQGHDSGRGAFLNVEVYP